MNQRALEAGARAAARVNGDDYDAIPADKPEWIRESGHFGGRFRDINEPFKSGYDEMSEAVITAYEAHLKAEGFVVVPAIPTQAMIEAGCDNNPTSWNEGTDLGFAADVANDVYRAMLSAATTGENDPLPDGERP